MRWRSWSWRLSRSASRFFSEDSQDLWVVPATAGVWTRFSLNIRYSKNPKKGFIKPTADLNRDGDFADPGEQGPKIRTYRLAGGLCDTLA